MTSDDTEEEDYLDEVTGSLTKGSRKRICKHMNHVAEGYGGVLRAEGAPRTGGGPGAAFDLKNGFSFNKKWDKCKCFEELIKVDPDLLVLCPPCGPFSQLQDWNYKRISWTKAIAILGEGVEHVNFAMRLYEWQVRRGKLALIERPRGSRAWQEESVQRCTKLPGVSVVTRDQCQFGLRVRREEELNKKPTNFMANGQRLNRALGRRCPGIMDTSIYSMDALKERNDTHLLYAEPL